MRVHHFVVKWLVCCSFQQEVNECWGFIILLCNGFSVIPSNKKLVSAALSVDVHFFIHHKKMGHAEMVNNLQHIREVVALFRRNVGIGFWCHHPSCTVVEVEDGGSTEASQSGYSSWRVL